MSAHVNRVRRLVAIGLVAGALALAGVANAALRPRLEAPALRLTTAVAPNVVTDGASSSAWYCAGPLPVGVPHEAASIAVTNLGSRAVSGEVVVASSVASGPSVTSLKVQPSGESVIGLARAGRRGAAAATVLVNGSGIAVEELVHGKSGVSASPCTDHTAAVNYIAAGSTLGANNLSLAVYDPGATPAVVGVSFVTNSGTVSPPAFQGLSVDAGHVDVLDVGHYVPNRAVVSTVVTSTGGHVVAGAFVAAVTDHSVLSSLTTGVGAPSSSWLIPAAPTGAGTTNTYDVLDPTNHAAKVTLRLGTSTSSSVLTASVPPNGVIALTPGSEAASGALRWASVSSAGAAVVVERETVLAKPVESAAAKNAARITAELAAKQAKAAAAAKAKAAAVAKAKAAAAAKALAAAKKAAKGHAPRVAPTTTTTTVVPPTTTTVVPYSAVSALPEVQPGVAVTSGVAAPSTSWVLPGGESDATTSEVVVVDNTSSVEARIQIGELGRSGSGPYGASPFASMPPLAVAPGAVLTVNLGDIVANLGTLPIVVSSSEPIVSGELLYAKKGTGFTLPAAIAIR